MEDDGSEGRKQARRRRHAQDEVVALPEPSLVDGGAASHLYTVYGLGLRTGLPLPLPEMSGPGRPLIELVEEAESHFLLSERGRTGARGDPGWFHHVRIGDGSDYLRWAGLFEFIVSSRGERIAYRAFEGASPEMLHTYLLSQVLSFALLKHGVEPLHATVVDVDGEGVALLGDCGYGKSTLGAAFIRAGCRLVTDDLLVVEPRGRRFVAHAGTPRIKLFPAMARSVLGYRPGGVPMNPGTGKSVMPLPAPAFSSSPRPLTRMYVLGPPRGRSKTIRIRPLSRARACVALVANTFNPIVVGRARLAQQLSFVARLAAQIPVRSLSYPRDLTLLPKVQQAIVADGGP